MELHVQPTGVADGLPFGIPSPEGGVGCMAVSAT